MSRPEERTPWRINITGWPAAASVVTLGFSLLVVVTESLLLPGIYWQNRDISTLLGAQALILSIITFSFAFRAATNSNTALVVKTFLAIIGVLLPAQLLALLISVSRTPPDEMSPDVWFGGAIALGTGGPVLAAIAMSLMSRPNPFAEPANHEIPQVSKAFLKLTCAFTISVNGEDTGPFTAAQVAEMVENGRITATTPVRCNNHRPIPAGKIPGIRF